MKQRQEVLLIELMAECSDMLLAGAPIATCLERYPEHAAELEPLLTTAVRVRASREVPLRAPETVERSRAMFMRAAQQLAAEQSQPATPSIIQRLHDGWQQVLAGLARAFSGYAGPRAMPAGLAMLLVVVMLGGLLATGAVTASARALPGDLLYPVKITAENMAIFLARDALQREALHQQFVERRLTEIQAIVTQGRTVRQMPITGSIEAFGPNAWQIAGLTIEITAQTQIEGLPQIGSAVEGVIRAPGDGGLIAVYLEVIGPRVAQPSPTPTLAPPTLRPPSTPTPTWMPTATLEPALNAVPAAVHLPPQPIFEPTDAPTATPTFTPTATPTATRTPRPTSTSTPTATTPAREIVKGRILGWVNSIESTYWLIDGNRVETNEDTLIEGNPGVGWRVEAEVALLPGDRYLGLRITALARPDYVEPWSAIEDVNAKGGDVWIIGGFRVHIGPDTVIEGDPQIGDTVEVSGERRADGEIWAKRIAVVRSQIYEFFGEVQSVSGSIWVISGTSVRVTDETQLIGNPSVGNWVGVRASMNSSNELIALLIYVASP